MIRTHCDSGWRKDVRWREPVVGDDIRKAAMRPLRRALARAGGTFSLRVTETIQMGRYCAAVIAWSADKNGRGIHGQAMAVYGFHLGRIVEVSFLAADSGHDQVFWEG